MVPFEKIRFIGFEEGNIKPLVTYFLDCGYNTRRASLAGAVIGIVKETPLLLYSLALPQLPPSHDQRASLD